MAWREKEMSVKKGISFYVAIFLPNNK